MADRTLYFPQLARRPSYRSASKYSAYRQEIREDCQGRCVYCDLHENELGGSEAMTLDHFRPKDKYPALEHDPANLVWSCHLCNQSKGNYWPAHGHPAHATYAGKRGFVDPFVEDMHGFYEVGPDGELIPLRPPAGFMIGIMKLNRQGAKTRRRARRVERDKHEAEIRFLIRRIREMDDALEYPGIPAALRLKLEGHKRALCRQYEEVMAERKPDFKLR